MFPILFRVLTIAGTCTLAALFTREMMRRKAEKEAEHERLREEKRDQKPALKISSRQEKADASSTPRVSNAEATAAADFDEQRKKREERKSTKKADEKTEKLTQQASASSSSSALASAAAEPGAEETRAKTVVDSSKKIIANYKQPPAYTVDLSLAQDTIKAAENLIAEGRFNEAWEKAGAVGMQMGMLEIRAGIEKELADLKGNPKFADKIPPVRATLDEADKHLTDARNSFYASAGSEPTFMSLMQAAMAKTMKAMSDANAIKLSL